MGRRLIALLVGVGVAVVAVVVVVLVLVLRGGPPTLPSGPGMHRLHDSATNSGGQQAPQRVVVDGQPYGFVVSVDDDETASLRINGPGGPGPITDVRVGTDLMVGPDTLTVLDIHEGDHPSDSFVDVRIVPAGPGATSSPLG